MNNNDTLLLLLLLLRSSSSCSFFCPFVLAIILLKQSRSRNSQREREREVYLSRESNFRSANLVNGFFFVLSIYDGKKTFEPFTTTGAS